jgi:hypothetical protein
MTAAKGLLWTQIALTVSAGGLAAVAMASAATRVSTTSGLTWSVGAAVSSPLPIACAVLLAGGALGLVAVHRASRAGCLRAGIVLITPAVLAIASIATAPSKAEAIPEEILPDEVLRSLNRMLALLTWAHRLAFVAAMLAAVCGVLILLSGRKTRHSPGPTASA